MIKTKIFTQPILANWKTPLGLLILLAIANQFSHQTWFTLLNNFTIEKAEFTGREIGILQSIREIPGFLAFGAILVILYMREQTLAYFSLLLLGVGVAATGLLPTEYGLYMTTLIMSLGFHYYETMNQSLSLQLLEKENMARDLGRILAAGSLACLAAYAMIWVSWEVLGLTYHHIYLIAGTVTLGITAFVLTRFPWFKQKHVQNKKLLLRKRYWLYYTLTFLAGARRQIFIVFAGFMMVEKFGYSVTHITGLYLLNHLFNMFMAPRIGNWIGHIGERRALTLEYIGLIIIFVTYAFVTNPTLAAFLYVADHAFFAMAIAIQTYFKKIADPADIAPTAGVAFSINHIAAVFLPVLLGVVWLYSHAAVFLTGAALAFASLIMARMIPDNPAQGNELVWHDPETGQHNIDNQGSKKTSL